MVWEKTVKQIVRDSHQEGAWDLLRAFVDAAERESGHECQAVEWARRMYRDPEVFQQFIHDSQALREGVR